MFGWSRALMAAAVAAASGLAGCGGGAPLPPVPHDEAANERQQQAFVEALKPRRAGRPVVAVLALNEGTEMTDLLLPHAVLQRAGVAELRVVAPRAGRVVLYPALQIDGAQDFAAFEQIHPSGADYVIVPAMRDDDDPAVTAWLRRQAQRGARVIGVCVGGLVVGRAGLLDGRRFASHWYYRGKLLDRHPSGTYVPHQRYVVDRDVATTTGITASVPTMLALVEAIGGRDRAQALAAELGVASWTPVHDSTPFALDAGRALGYVLNKATFWRRERWSVDVRDGMDDVALALAADAWSRTGRVDVEATAARPVTLRSGLVPVAQPAAQALPRLPLVPALKPVQQLDRTLCEIGERYGTSARDRVMLEMEYPQAAGACAG
ncbi:DJ-1/PfpI family protein [Piscinibacter sp. XHJ-5]|uniref:DJ-1/PfpI family protein n=1 Tax=Piscinibacter sp. XHJ-5 TaxID=3037797 RepID=UPI002453632B|nr:DJ-1/PfpI family protein [Piscinibacter sp. XHJ-5]